MSKTIAILVGLGLLIALVLFSMTYTVNFNEVAIKTRFSQTSSRSIVDEPGLHFKLPLIADKVTKIDKRLQLRESALETIQTADGQQVTVRAYLMWKVDENNEGPLTFFSKFPGGVEDANNLLVDPLRTAMRVGMSQFAFDDLIGPKSRLRDAEQAIRSEMVAVSSKSGIEPVSVGISQLMLPPKTTLAVIDRMVATRNKLADVERNRGQFDATAIQSRARANADKIRAFANQRAAEIRAVGSKNAAQYLTLMNEEPGLAIFLTWLDALESSLSRYTTLIIPTSYSPMHLVDLKAPLDQQGFPQPAAGVDAPIAAPKTITKQSDGTAPKPNDAAANTPADPVAQPETDPAAKRGS
jgi:modulator of FtsH protease HflC